MPVDYSKGIIYKIVCKNPELKGVYVGSTTNLKQRKRQHKCAFSKQHYPLYNIKLYQYIRENGGWENFELVKIEDFPCSTKWDLEKKEREWLEALKADLNQALPTRSPKEYKEAKKDYYKDYMIKYQKKNNDFLKEQKRRHYQLNKEAIQEARKEKVNCECGCMIRKGHIARHRKSIKHIQLLKE